MIRLLLILFLTGYTISALAQDNMLALKKRSNTIQRFWKNGYISFQLQDGRWMKGVITKIANDSFYLTTEIITNSLLRADTQHYSGYHYAISDIYALPKRGLQIDYINGEFQINKAAGHMHFYWVKSGWLFRAGAIGYVALDAANGLIKHNFTFSGSKYGIAAGVFAGGVLLKKVYKVTYRLGKKYRLEVVKM